MTIYTVSSSQELSQAMAKAQSGDQIELAEGHYGDLRISKMNFSSEVVIKSADADAPATFGSLYFAESSNITLDGIVVDFVPTEDTRDYSAAVQIRYSQNIEISNSDISGGDAVNGISADSKESDLNGNGVEGYPIGKGIFIYLSDDITLDNNEIYEFKAGIGIAHVDGLNIIDNDLYHLRTTHINGGNGDNILIEGNVMSDLISWRSPHGGGDHGDYIHFWTGDGQAAANENITIRDNYMFEGETGVAAPILGIYLDDNGQSIGFKNVIIEENIMHHGNRQGVRLEYADGVSIENNTFLQSSGDEGAAPGFVLTQGTKNVLIKNNILADIVGSSVDDAAAFNIVIENNLEVQRFDAAASNYVGDLYTNALTRVAALQDLMVVPGSAADGYGATKTQLETAGETFVGIGAITGDGLGMMHVFMSAHLLFGSESEIDLDTAEIDWDFGDGTSFNGLDVIHKYDKAGTYEVHAYITLDDGTALDIRKTIVVSTPVGIHANFNSGVKDLSDVVNGLKTEEDVSLVTTDLGSSLRLNSSDSALEFQISSELLDNTQYTLALKIRMDSSDEGGRLLSFPGVASLSIVNGELTLSGTTSEDEKISFATKNANLDDGKWHDIAYVFTEDGSAILYIDGSVVGQVDDLEGIQADSGFHGLTIGSKFGGSFTGLVDDVNFLRAGLDAEEIQQLIDGQSMAENEVEFVVPTVTTFDTTQATTPTLQTSVTTSEKVEILETNVGSTVATHSAFTIEIAATQKSVEVSGIPDAEFTFVQNVPVETPDSYGPSQVHVSPSTGFLSNSDWIELFLDSDNTELESSYLTQEAAVGSFLQDFGDFVA